MTDNNDFSRYELLVLHRLQQLERDTKELHQAFEDLRVDVVTLRAETRTRAAMIATSISILIGAAGVLLPFLLGLY